MSEQKKLYRIALRVKNLVPALVLGSDYSEVYMEERLESRLMRSISPKRTKHININIIIHIYTSFVTTPSTTMDHQRILATH